MTQSSNAVALAARAHGRDGRVLSSPEVIARMRAAAATLGETDRTTLAGPTDVVGGETVVLQLSSPEAVLPAALALAASVRPSKTTFCAARAYSSDPDTPPAGDPLEAALLTADRASTEAAGRLSETDSRETRFLVAGPSPASLVGALVGLILEAYDSMTDRQRQMVDLVRTSDTQQQVAIHLGISRQAVNQSLAAAGWPYLERAEAVVRNQLLTLWNRPDARDA